MTELTKLLFWLDNEIDYAAGQKNNKQIGSKEIRKAWEAREDILKDVRREVAKLVNWNGGRGRG
jgi:hypothetical protein